MVKNLNTVDQGRNVRHGHQAGYLNQGETAIAIGKDAGKLSQTNGAISVGEFSGYQNQGNDCVAIGGGSGQEYQEEGAIAVGVDAGKNNQKQLAIAIGGDSGRTNQLSHSIAIGHRAGYSSQGIGSDPIVGNAIAIGREAGQTNQQANSIAIGKSAGNTGQSNNSIAIGSSAGHENLGEYSIAIGSSAGFTSNDNTITLNATGAELHASNTGACYIKPIRFLDTLNANVLTYIPETGEVVDSNAITFRAGSTLVGINNSNPTHTLDVGQHLSVNNSGGTTNVLTVRGGVESTGNLKVSTELFVDSISKCVGICNSDPQNMLDVGDKLSIHATGDKVLSVKGNMTAMKLELSKDMVVQGNLHVHGTETIVNTEKILVEDPIMELANNIQDVTQDVGIIMRRPGTESSVFIGYHGTPKELSIGYTKDTIHSNTLTTATLEYIPVNIHGSLTVGPDDTVSNVVEVTGNVNATDHLLAPHVVAHTDLKVGEVLTVDKGAANKVEVTGNVNATDHLLALHVIAHTDLKVGEVITVDTHKVEVNKDIYVNTLKFKGGSRDDAFVMYHDGNKMDFVNNRGEFDYRIERGDMNIKLGNNKLNVRTTRDNDKPNLLEVDTEIDTLTLRGTAKIDDIEVGNLHVHGTTTTIHTERLEVKDPIIGLGHGNESLEVSWDTLGLLMETGSSQSNVFAGYTDNKYQIGFTSSGIHDTTVALTGDIPVKVNGSLTVGNMNTGTPTQVNSIIYYDPNNKDLSHISRNGSNLFIINNRDIHKSVDGGSSFVFDLTLRADVNHVEYITALDTTVILGNDGLGISYKGDKLTYMPYEPFDYKWFFYNKDFSDKYIIGGDDGKDTWIIRGNPFDISTIDKVFNIIINDVTYDSIHNQLYGISDSTIYILPADKIGDFSTVKDCTPTSLNSISYSPTLDILIAVGDESKIVKSKDISKSTWDVVTLPHGDENLYTIKWLQYVFFIIGETNCFYSYDGINWTRVTNDYKITDIVYFKNDVFTTIDTGGIIGSLTLPHIHRLHDLKVGEVLTVDKGASNVVEVTGNVNTTDHLLAPHMIAHNDLKVGEVLTVDKEALNVVEVTGNVNATDHLLAPHVIAHNDLKVGEVLTVDKEAPNVVEVSGNVNATDHLLAPHVIAHNDLKVGEVLTVDKDALDVVEILGNVGIGTIDNPRSNLRVHGTLTVQGDVACYFNNFIGSRSDILPTPALSYRNIRVYNTNTGSDELVPSILPGVNEPGGVYPELADGEVQLGSKDCKFHTIYTKTMKRGNGTLPDNYYIIVDNSNPYTPRIYPSNDRNGELGTSLNRWSYVYTNRIMASEYLDNDGNHVFSNRNITGKSAVFEDDIRATSYQDINGNTIIDSNRIITGKSAVFEDDITCSGDITAIGKVTADGGFETTGDLIATYLTPRDPGTGVMIYNYTQSSIASSGRSCLYKCFYHETGAADWITAVLSCDDGYNFIGNDPYSKNAYCILPANNSIGGNAGFEYEHGFYFANDQGFMGFWNFTGQHRCKPVDVTYISKDREGYIVKSTGKYKNTNSKSGNNIDSISVSESLPVVSITYTREDKSVLGIISLVDDTTTSSRADSNGPIGIFESKDTGDDRVYVNSVGEGAVWVSDFNGPIENGDYITTSDIPGVGMKQTTAQMMNYTVAKSTMDCDFACVFEPKRVARTTKTTVKERKRRMEERDVESSEIQDVYDEDTNRWVRKTVITTNRESIHLKETVALYDEDGKIINPELEIDAYDIIENIEEVVHIDENGDVIYDETDEMVAPYKMKYVKIDGTIITELEYISAKTIGEPVYRMAFVGCTYHCG